ncbi:MAG: Hpt domain-containing protein, partial [Planctomycetes bacterium]|nr:Hpt domain-containing protein [Planctomycetota bacterium]
MTDPLYSSYADDEDMLELVEMFVEELPDRVHSLESAISQGDLPQLETLAHQIKGSAGSYGFQVITEAAGRLEHLLK